MTKRPYLFVAVDVEPEGCFGHGENLPHVLNNLRGSIQAALEDLCGHRKDGDSVVFEVTRHDMTEAEVDALPEV
jgi:hypothetical protein